MPLLYTRDGNPAFLGNTFHNQACFYIGCGPSLLKEDLSLLSSRGILTFAVNNVAANLVKPNLWCCVDEPKSFHNVIWDDPTIMKFLPQNKGGKHYMRWGKNSMQPAQHSPNTFTFQLKDKKFNHLSFLDEKTVSWGCDTNITGSLGFKGARSVMLVAIKLMYFLGFKRIYLLGCDFNMQHDKTKKGTGLTYAFEQYKHQGGTATNNACYKIIDSRLGALKPLLEEKGCQIYNITKESSLTSLPVMAFEEAIKKETVNFNKQVSTGGMYG